MLGDSLKLLLRHSSPQSFFLENELSQDNLPCDDKQVTGPAFLCATQHSYSALPLRPANLSFYTLGVSELVNTFQQLHTVPLCPLSSEASLKPSSRMSWAEPSQIPRQSTFFKKCLQLAVVLTIPQCSPQVLHFHSPVVC